MGIFAVAAARNPADARAMKEGSFNVASDEERGTLGAILSHSFGFPPDDAKRWFERAGHDNVYAYYDARGAGPHVTGTLTGGLLLIPMGQFFGGKSVPMMGVAGVGIGPESRGSGAGTRMMRRALTVMRERGALISTLYPATVPIYQRVGYERAGARFELEIHPRDLVAASLGDRRTLDIVSIANPDDTLAALQKEFVSHIEGAIDRGPYVWERVFRPYQYLTVGFAIIDNGKPVGHIVVAHRQSTGHDTEVIVTDASALNVKAVRRIFGFLGDYRSLAHRVLWPQSLPGPFSMLLPDRHYRTRLLDSWMVRILDLPGALVARGYGKTRRGQVDIEIEDDILTDNNGRYTLTVQDGSAHVERGGKGNVRMHIRTFASVYSGYMSPLALKNSGLLEGDSDSLAMLGELFAGPLPSMSEMF